MRSVFVDTFKFLSLFFLSFSVSSCGRNEETNSNGKNEAVITPHVEIYDTKTTPEKAKVEKASINQNEIKNYFSKAVNGVINGVVSIQVTQNSNEKDLSEMFDGFNGTPFDDFFKHFFGDQQKRSRTLQSIGSGFFIHKDKNFYYILTNSHVVEKSQRISVLLDNGTKILASLHGADSGSDLAVLKVDAKEIDEKKINILKWGDSSALEMGEFVVAIGSPFGLQNTVSLGIVSYKSRNLEKSGKARYADDFIQHTAQINMGNSGGCLINCNGEVVGINTIIFSTNGGNIGIGFAIPSEIAKNVVDQLLKNKKVHRSAIGVSVQDLDSEMMKKFKISGYGSSAMISSINKGSPAEKSGLKVEDIIVEYDGAEVKNKGNLARKISESDPAKIHKVLVLRAGKNDDYSKIEIELKLSDYDSVHQVTIDKTSKDKAQFSTNLIEKMFGFSLVEKNGEIKIASVEEGGEASAQEVKKGDVILKADNKRLTSFKDFEEYIKAAIKNNEENVYLTIKSNDSISCKTFPLEKKKEKIKKFKAYTK